MRCAVIGAGMAGLACADRLYAAGHQVVLFDKGRGPGGRMSTRRLETPLGPVYFDHGAPYFTARGRAFRDLVLDWERAGVVARWPDAGLDAWVGTPGMNAPIKAMAARHDVRWACRVTGLERLDGRWAVLHEGGSEAGFDVAIAAIPAEQVAPLVSLHDFQMARDAIRVHLRPCWSAMFAFDRTVEGTPGLLRHDGILAGATRNSAKPGRGGVEAWVVHADPHWSQTHIEDMDDAICTDLLDALERRLGVGLPAPVAAVAHRWRYAMPSGNVAGALWNPALMLGACGDWLLDGYVELAWLSGRDLATRITETDASALSGAG